MFESHILGIVHWIIQKMQLHIKCYYFEIEGALFNNPVYIYI